MTKEEAIELLAEVDSAIHSLVVNKVKSYRLGDRSFTYLDVEELLRWRAELRRIISGGIFTVNVQNGDE